MADPFRQSLGRLNLNDYVVYQAGSGDFYVGQVYALHSGENPGVSIRILDTRITGIKEVDAMVTRPEGRAGRGVAIGYGLIVPFTREVLVGETTLAPGELETMLGHIVPAGNDGAVRRLISQWPDVLKAANREAMQPVKERLVVVVTDPQNP